MFCNKCGAQLNDNAVFCTKCGNRVQAAGAPAQPAQPAVKAATVNPLAAKSAAEIRNYMSYGAAALSILSLIFWFLIKFEVSAWGMTSAASLYEVFFESAHTTYLTVFVALGYIATAAFAVLPTLSTELKLIPKAKAAKFAIKSSIATTVLAFLCLYSGSQIADSYTDASMNFAGWLVIILSIAVVALLIYIAQSAKKNP
jgi:hypothetical protein